jgi:hypothetical protein
MRFGVKELLICYRVSYELRSWFHLWSENLCQVENKLRKHQHPCKRLDSNCIHLLDVKVHMPSLHTIRTVVSPKSQPGGFSVTSHGNINGKEGNNCGHAHRTKHCVYTLRGADIHTHVDTSRWAIFCIFTVLHKLFHLKSLSRIHCCIQRVESDFCKSSLSLAARIEQCTFYSNGKYDVIMCF